MQVIKNTLPKNYHIRQGPVITAEQNGTKERWERIVQEVKEAVLGGTFAEYVINGSGKDSNNASFDGLWLAVNNNIGTIRYDKAKELYGSRERFKLHGLVSLTHDEALGINQSIAEEIEPFYQAFQFLTDYKKS